MSEEMIMNLGQETLKTAVLLAGPMLGAALVVGLIISVFQTITQINEATLTFIPKLIVVALVLVVGGSWMIDVMSRFTIGLFENLSAYVRN